MALGHGILQNVSWEKVHSVMLLRNGKSVGLLMFALYLKNLKQVETS